jgi:hypothetical protein
MDDAGRLTDLLRYVTSKGRVCPRPRAWHAFWELLPRYGGNEAPVPLILGAWHDSDAHEKRRRLRDQIEFAAREGSLAIADKYLRALPEEQWSDGDRI